jgi:hypothetical protein
LCIKQLSIHPQLDPGDFVFVLGQGTHNDRLSYWDSIAVFGRADGYRGLGSSLRAQEVITTQSQESEDDSKGTQTAQDSGKFAALLSTRFGGGGLGVSSVSHCFSP